MRLGHRGVPQRRLAALLALATSLTLSTTPPCAHAAQVPGIVSQADLAAQQAAVQTSGASRQACQVVFRPYPTWGPPGYLNPAAADLPTASPPAEYVSASLTFDVVNLGTEDIPAGWNFSLTNSYYTRIEQVFNLQLVSFDDGVLRGYSNASTQALAAKAGNNVTAGFVVRASVNAFLPDTFCIGDLKCSIVLVNDISGSYLPFQASGEDNANTEAAEQPISLSNGEFLDVNGNPLTLKCANWFGFNNGNVMLDGLWAGQSALVNDFAIVMYRIQLLGINCFRVPFSFESLFNAAPFSWANPNCTRTSGPEIRANVLPPGVTTNLQLPPLAFPEGNNVSICNEKLPNESVYKRFLYILQFMAYNNFYILIDDHSEDTTVMTNSTKWSTSWARIIKDIIQDPRVGNRVMVDLLNEPDSYKLNWNNGLGNLYLDAMDKIYAVSPSTLMLIEGSMTGGVGNTGINWGDGFVSDDTVLRSTGLTDPRPFFNTLLGKPYLNNVALSPHMYPPSITKTFNGISGNDLYSRLFNSFGSLRTNGYGGHKFPILVGEIGSMFDINKSTCCDLPFMRDALAWLQARPNTGATHAPIKNIAYWAWNANSGDSGGLVDNSWVNILWTKVNWMQEATGMTPWYLAPATPAPTASPPPAAAAASPPPRSPPPAISPPPPVPTPPPPAASPPPPAISPPPPAASSPPPVTASPSPVASPSPTSARTPSPVTSPPPPTISPPPPAAVRRPPPPSPRPSPPPPVQAPVTSGIACVASLRIDTPWPYNGGYQSSINVNLKNLGSATVRSPYTVTMAQASWTALPQYWNWAATLGARGVVTGSVNGGSWQGLQPRGGNAASFGVLLISSQNTFRPTLFTVNGVPCTIA